MVQKNNEVPELSDSDWITDLAFLLDITIHLNALNCKLQGKNIVISEAFDLIRAFETKLQLWTFQLEQGCFDHFEHLKEAKTVVEAPPVAFNSSKFAKKISEVYEAFKKRFSGFREVQDQLEMFSNPFGVNPQMVPSFMRLELIDLQCNTGPENQFDQPPN